MGILKNLFGGQKNEAPAAKITWNRLETMEQLDELYEQSSERYQAIFKHSTRCGISSGVLRQFERQDDLEEVDFYLLDLLSHRDLSSEIAQRSGVWHESPQLIVLKDKKVKAHASHYDIMRLSLD